VRKPFKAPYTKEDLPQLDLLHAEIGILDQWLASARRREIELTEPEKKK
jgi:hypothetical protein